MKWEELKELIEAAGVDDNTDIDEIDLFYPFDSPEDEPKIELKNGYAAIWN